MAEGSAARCAGSTLSATRRSRLVSRAQVDGAHPAGTQRLSRPRSLQGAAPPPEPAGGSGRARRARPERRGPPAGSEKPEATPLPGLELGVVAAGLLQEGRHRPGGLSRARWSQDAVTRAHLCGLMSRGGRSTPPEKATGRAPVSQSRRTVMGATPPPRRRFPPGSARRRTAARRRRGARPWLYPASRSASSSARMSQAASSRRDGDRLHLHPAEEAAALLGAAPARVVHQDLSHQPGTNAEEVGARFGERAPGRPGARRSRGPEPSAARCVRRARAAGSPLRDAAQFPYRREG